MLHKLNDSRLIDYKKGSIVILTDDGAKIGKQDDSQHPIVGKF